ncbi:hypothetical protein M514_03569 [Trichuris suis]|uniref:Uncharacterized protein n=1 Tax=Trichuris suis TaxID=68888 RepID=A0A085ME71_9BILA|nr:hypothetical protein M513_03569 [Trichuris suis]KFD71318.1 hypothetical protein M514_03569 [Trichuris suis]
MITFHREANGSQIEQVLSSVDKKALSVQEVVMDYCIAPDEHPTTRCKEIVLEIQFAQHRAVIRPP